MQASVELVFCFTAAVAQQVVEASKTFTLANKNISSVVINVIFLNYLNCLFLFSLVICIRTVCLLFGAFFLCVPRWQALILWCMESTDELKWGER